MAGIKDRRATLPNMERIEGMSSNKWMGKNSHPPMGRWYYTRNHDGSVASRYYDDSGDSWWCASAKYGFTPNDSFIEWLWVPEVMQPRDAGKEEG